MRVVGDQTWPVAVSCGPITQLFDAAVPRIEPVAAEAALRLPIGGEQRQQVAVAILAVERARARCRRSCRSSRRNVGCHPDLDAGRAISSAARGRRVRAFLLDARVDRSGVGRSRP